MKTKSLSAQAPTRLRSHPENEPLCSELLRAPLRAAAIPTAAHTDALFRLQPERWLESRLRNDIAELLPSLRGDLFYSQVPALSAGDRGMLDLLTLDRDGRLAVIELKADEDLHLPMQALDYWIRVRALNQDRRAWPAVPTALSAFERQGYFAGAEVSPLPPRLSLAAPALRIHPANEPVLRYFSPEVEWELIALGEHWRRELEVVFPQTRLIAKLESSHQSRMRCPGISSVVSGAIVARWISSVFSTRDFSIYH